MIQYHPIKILPTLKIQIKSWLFLIKKTLFKQPDIKMKVKWSKLADQNRN